MVPRPDRSHHRRARPPRGESGFARHGPEVVAARQAPRVLRRPARPPVRRRARPTCAPLASRRVSRSTFKTVDTCGAEFEASTPYHYGTYEDEDEVRAGRAPTHRDPRVGPEPHRPGHRVRLLLRARVVRAARRGLRDRDGQLQPRDGVDRLRHERPALLRAAHRTRTCSTSSTARAGRVGGVIVALGGQTPLKLAAVLPPELVWARAPESIDRAEDREQWNALCAQLEIPQPAGGTATASTRRSPSPRGWATRCSCARPTCSAGGRCRSSTTTTSSLHAMAELATRGEPRARGWPVGRAAGAHRPLPRGRGRGRRRRDPRRDRRGADRRRHGARRGGRRALGRLGLRAPAALAAARPSSR